MSVIYFGWNPSATETFRWTSNKAPQGGGFNGQTEPKALRYIHHAPRGHVYGQKDLKQAEARAVAHFARAKRLLQIFEDPSANLYIGQGKFIYEAEITKDMPLYTLCKGIIHAAHYDEGPYKLAWDTGISVGDATKFRDNYRKANPEIPKWHESTVAEVLANGYLEVPLYGLRRTFYEALSFYKIHGTITDQQRKDAIAWKPQTLIPQIITVALLKARPLLPPEVWLHAHGHDSVLWSCPSSIFASVEKIMDEAMDVAIPINGMVMRVPRETTVGYTVGDMMDYDGEVPSTATWTKWRDAKLHKKSRRRQILEGVYGPHIKA